MTAGAVVVVTGATGPAGRATTAALAAAGFQVVAVGRDRSRLEELAAGGGVAVEVADLSSQAETTALAGRIRDSHGRIDGLVHLVGGWRGAPRFTANSDEDWAVLSGALVDSLRHATVALHDDLVASPVGRAVIVSATSVQQPTPGTASYVAAKAAAEAWMSALAVSFRRAQSGRKADPVPQTSAAVILVIKALVDESMRGAEPDRDFAGFTDVGALANRVVALFAEDAAALNGARLPV